MVTLDRLNSLDGYTFDEGVAFLVLVQSPVGVINHIKATHNRKQLHSEIHRMLRIPRTRDFLRSNHPDVLGNFPVIPQNSSKVQSATTPVVAGEQEAADNEVGEKSTETDTDDILPESDKKLPKSDEKLPKSEDETEIILTKEDLDGHKYTRLDQMPNELTRTLWLKKQDVYREMQQAHLKMRAVPEGEEHDEERAHWRSEVLRLYGEKNDYWKQIDAEIERLKSEQEREDKKADEKPSFDVSTYRSYISKALRKKELTPAQLAELQRRVEAMIAAKVELKPETVEKLKAKGIHFPE